MDFTTGSLVSRLPGTKTTSIAATLNTIRVTDKALGKAKYEHNEQEEAGKVIRCSLFVVNNGQTSTFYQPGVRDCAQIH